MRDINIPMYIVNRKRPGVSKSVQKSVKAFINEPVKASKSEIKA